MKVLVFALVLVIPSSLGLAQTPAPSPSPSAAAVVYERKDTQGRVINRFTFRPDGTVSQLAVAYGAGSEQLTLDEDLDQKREPVRRLREHTDRRGRIVEREELSTTNGHKLTRRTKFKYDAKGRQTVETEVIE